MAVLEIKNMPIMEMSTIIRTKIATSISTMELPFAFLRENIHRRPSYPRAASEAAFSFTSRHDVKTITSLPAV
jgi:hypothetical protein